MLERDLYENYGISHFNMTEYKGYDAFRYRGALYVFVPINGLEQEDLLELKQMSDYLQYQREDTIAVFVPTLKQELIASINQQLVVLLKVNESIMIRHKQPQGMYLASFHKKGRYLPNPPQRMNRIGQWKDLWEKRLDQLENFWSQKIQERPANHFEKVFFETFPYYLGLTENAIQYIADCQYEDQRNEMTMGTICHLRYNLNQTDGIMVLPTELVYDHPSRDLAEWVRNHYLSNARNEDIVNFFNEYEQVMPLTETGWRLLYGRLLFPLSYFECIEGYYTTATQSETDHYENKLYRLVEQANDYEQFLASFYYTIGLPIEKLRIPEVEWLKNKKVKI